jgi:PPP family 3-phenylpropionic acid transporter
MSGNSEQSTDQPAATRLAVFYATLFAAAGIHLPFFPVWLAAKGLDAGAIGLVLAAPMVVRLVAIPLATRAADRPNALRTVLVIASVMSAAGMALVGLAEGALVILVAFTLASIPWTPVMPLTDAYALKRLSIASYGPVRLWGSAAFIAGSVGAGWLADVIAARHLIWLIVAAMIAIAAAALALPSLPHDLASPDNPAARVRRLFTPTFIAVAAASSLVQASHAVYYGFSTIDWKAAGLDGTAIGALWALGVLAEIALFALAGRLPAMVGPSTLLVIGAAGAVVRWTAMAFNPPALVLPLLQCLHGLSFGATHLGVIGFIARGAPAQLVATAQGYLATAYGLVMAATMGFSGALYGAYGSLAYGAMALTAAAGGLSALTAYCLMRKGLAP